MVIRIEWSKIIITRHSEKIYRSRYSISLRAGTIGQANINMYNNARIASVPTRQYPDTMENHLVDKEEKLWKNNAVLYENNGNIGDSFILNYPRYLGLISVNDSLHVIVFLQIPKIIWSYPTDHLRTCGKHIQAHQRCMACHFLAHQEVFLLSFSGYWLLWQD